MRRSLCLLALWQAQSQRLPHSRSHGHLQADVVKSPEAETLLRAQQYWAKLRHRSWSDWDETQLQAFDHLLAARKFGPHELLHPQESSDQGMSWLQGLVSAEWCFLGIVMGMLLTMDALLLQNLPESRRSHVCVLLIWLAVTLACCVEVWVCAGADAGTTWLFGYLMELLYSADHVFVIQLVFSSLDTPHRLMPKALYLAMIGNMAFRFLGFLRAPVNTRFFSWVMGTGLVYAGISRLVFQRLEHCPDVTESAIVRFLRLLLGERLGEFYDEEGEAILVDVKGKYRISLLGVALLCLFAVNFLLSFDVVLAKSEASDDVFLNFSSSILALFAIRSLFFVVRDFFTLSTVTRSTLALVLLLMGLEMLTGPAVYVNAFASCVVFASMLALSVGVSTLQQSHAKLPFSALH